MKRLPSRSELRARPSATAGRQTWMDVLRGVAIILLLVWHAPAIPALIGVEMPEWVRIANAALLPFRMPTLMFLSGLLLPRSLAKPLPAYYSGKLRLIAWPYFVWAALHLVLYGGRPMYDPQAWLATGYLWFLFYLLGYYLVAPLFRRLPSWVPLLLAIVGAFAFDHWLLHRFAYFGVFFFAGYVLAPHLPRIMAYTRRPWAIAVIGCTGAGVAAYSAMAGVQYLSAAAPLVIVGILGLAQLATLAAGYAWSRPLQFVGRTSIVYYVVHFPVMLLVARGMVGLGITDWLPVAAATLASALVVCTVLARYRHAVPVEYLFEAPTFRRRSARTVPASAAERGNST